MTRSVVGDAVIEGGGRPGSVHGAEQALRHDGAGEGRGALLPSLRH